MRVGRRAKRLRGFVYIPLTPRDEAVHRDLRYRVGRWVDTTAWGQFLALAVFAAFGLPIGVLLDWRDGSVDDQRPRLLVVLALMWLVALALIYAWWYAQRQKRSELQRGYSFYVDPEEADAQVAEAKSVLLRLHSSSEERERAIELLVSRRACSLPGEPPSRTSN
jgi:hypothetical protein